MSDPSCNICQNFYLHELDISTNSLLASITGSDTAAFDASATAVFDVSATVLQSLFQFYTNSDDITDVIADDLKYRVVYTPSDPVTPLSSNFIVNANIGAPTSSTYGAIPYTGATGSNMLPYDYVRYLALRIFNTSSGVDLFSNEVNLRDDLDTSSKNSLNVKLIDLSNNGVLDASASAQNPSYSILNQIIDNNPWRLQVLHEVDISSNWYYTPILEGDSLYFIMTIHAAGNQTSSTGSSVEPRPYRMKINVVGNTNMWEGFPTVASS